MIFLTLVFLCLTLVFIFGLALFLIWIVEKRIAWRSYSHNFLLEKMCAFEIRRPSCKSTTPNYTRDFFNITEPNNAYPKYFSIAFLRELSACFLNAEPVSKFCPEILIFKKTILQKY